MNYVKKMCILRQVKQGFSGDGKALSGLVKIEQYGKNLAVEVSIINFAPLVSGEYFCLLSDGKGKTEMLSLRGKSLFNLLSDLDISGGFCAVVCYVKNEIVPIAYGINGNGSYDWRSILNATLPPVFPRATQENAASATPYREDIFNKNAKQKQTTDDFSGIKGDNEENEPPMYETNPPELPPSKKKTKQEEAAKKEVTPPVPPSTERAFPDSNKPERKQEPSSDYDDETVASENYFGRENDEYDEFTQTGKNAHSESATEKPRKETGTDSAKDGNADRVLHPFKTDSDGYYQAAKAELDELFRAYPRDKTLNGAFACSDWVRVKGDQKQPQYLVGVLYDDGKAKYICYALAAEHSDAPPNEIKNVCTFVPCSLLKEKKGFFIIFQSAATGECIKPERA